MLDRQLLLCYTMPSKERGTEMKNQKPDVTLKMAVGAILLLVFGLQLFGYYTLPLGVWFVLAFTYYIIDNFEDWQ